MNNDNKVMQSSPPSVEEEKWFDFAENLPFLSDEYLAKFSDKLLTLSSAGIGVYLTIIKIDNQTMSDMFWIPLVIFFSAMLCSLSSIYPRKVGGEYYELIDIKRNYLSGLNRRKKHIILGLYLYLAGILSGVLTIMIY